MAPRTKAAETQKFRASSEHQAELREALAQIERGEVVELTEKELRHWVETGEWPASLD
jgi:hypothetical protein